MELPEVLEPGRFMDDLPVFRIATFPLAVVHHSHPRPDGMHQLRRSRMIVAMARRVKHIESAYQIVGADQLVLLVPGQVAEIEKPEVAVSDDDPDGFKVLRRGI